MDKDLENLGYIYRHQLQEFEKGGYSPAKVKAYARTVELIEESETVEQWKAKMEKDGQFREIGKAVTSDQYYSTGKANMDSGYPIIGQAYLDAAKEILTAESDEEGLELTKKITEKINAAEDEDYEIRSGFRYIFDYLFKFYTMGSLPQEMVYELRKRVKAYGGRELFYKVARDPNYNSIWPISDKVREEVLKKLPAMLNQEEEDITPEIQEWVNQKFSECSDLLNEFQELYHHFLYLEDKKREFIAEAPMEEPGSYKIEMVFEKEKKDISEDVWAQAVKDGQKLKELKNDEKTKAEVTDLFSASGRMGIL
ncbi:MAG: hypothetical protein ACLFR1_14875 [Spirochaetia bacterium]